MMEKQRKFLFACKYEIFKLLSQSKHCSGFENVCLSHVTECVAHFTGYQYMKTGCSFRGNVEGFLIYLLKNSILECYAYSTKF